MEATKGRCQYHQEERLRFVCTQCDQIICRDCKMTKHEGHETDDISSVAGKARVKISLQCSQLQTGIHIIQSQRREAETSLQRLEDSVKESATIVNEKSDLLMNKITHARNDKLEAVNEIANEERKKLVKFVEELKRKEVDLERLEHVKTNVLMSQSDLQLIDFVKTQKPENQLTCRDLLVSDVNYGVQVAITRANDFDRDEDIKRFFGEPVLAQTDKKHPSMAILQEFRCSDDVSSHVKAISSRDGIVSVIYSEKKTNTTEQYVLVFDTRTETDLMRKKTTENETVQVAMRGTASLLLYPVLLGNGPEKPFAFEVHTRTTSVDRNTNKEGFPVFSLKHSKHKGMFRVCEKMASADASWRKLFRICMDHDPIAICSDNFGQHFAVIQRQAGSNTSYSVALFRKPRSVRFAVFQPTIKGFLPSAICFFTVCFEKVLLVADQANDKIYVVKFAELDKGVSENENEKQNEYIDKAGELCTGCPWLQAPTALTVDESGILWIGCKGGVILKCVPTSELRTYHKTNAQSGSDAESPYDMAYPEELHETERKTPVSCRNTSVPRYTELPSSKMNERPVPTALPPQQPTGRSSCSQPDGHDPAMPTTVSEDSLSQNAYNTPLNNKAALLSTPETESKAQDSSVEDRTSPCNTQPEAARGQRADSPDQIIQDYENYDEAASPDTDKGMFHFKRSQHCSSADSCAPPSYESSREIGIHAEESMRAAHAGNPESPESDTIGRLSGAADHQQEPCRTSRTNRNDKHDLSQPISDENWQGVYRVSQGGEMFHLASDVSLWIPPGAVGEEDVNICTIVRSDSAFIRQKLMQKIELLECERVASPLAEFWVGHEYHFKQAVQITLPHCLPRDFDLRQVTVYRMSHTSDGTPLVTEVRYIVQFLAAASNSDHQEKKCEMRTIPYEQSAYFQLLVQGGFLVVNTDHMSLYVCTYKDYNGPVLAEMPCTSALETTSQLSHPFLKRSVTNVTESPYVTFPFRLCSPSSLTPSAQPEQIVHVPVASAHGTSSWSPASCVLQSPGRAFQMHEVSQSSVSTVTAERIPAQGRGSVSSTPKRGQLAPQPQPDQNTLQMGPTKLLENPEARGGASEAEESGERGACRNQMMTLQPRQIETIARVLNLADDLDELRSRYADDETYKKDLINRCLKNDQDERLPLLLSLAFDVPQLRDNHETAPTVSMTRQSEVADGELATSCSSQGGQDICIREHSFFRACDRDVNEEHSRECSKISRKSVTVRPDFSLLEEGRYCKEPCSYRDQDTSRPTADFIKCDRRQKIVSGGTARRFNYPQDLAGD
ncbi:hypothetical protein BaRGS_00017041, partial [Batillaria attramentaria]